MQSNKLDVSKLLQGLGLSNDESEAWLTLLIEGPKTHMGIAQSTGINRTTVYRLVDALSDKSLVHELATEQGNFIEAAGPETLALMLQRGEIELAQKRQVLDELLGALPALQASDHTGFSVKTYYGVAGLKQMLWNELKMQTESVQFTRTTLNDIAGVAFAEKFRAEIIARKIKQRALENVRGVTMAATKHQAYQNHYNVRYIEPRILAIGQELTVHDDIVSVYNWEDDMLVGTETKNAHYANFMRQVFETYWQLAEE